ncbi:MAG: hypothetical protein QXF15_02865 [Candidatus Aenigmatarchaeota archaeon]
MKGIESEPLRYVLLILVSIMIISVFIAILSNLQASAMAISKSTNTTLHGLLNSSLSNALKIK